MNENQLQELYNRISAADATYSKRYTFDQFKANMQDQAYVDKLSGWASSRGISMSVEENQPPAKQPPAQQQPVTAFNAADLLKKKSIQSVSSSDQSSSASTSDGDGLAAMQEALSYKPQPLPSEGTRAGVPPIKQQQKVQQQIQKREEKRVEKMTQSPQFFKDQISGINADLMSKEEEYVVPQLNYKFGPMGFKFEESGISNQMVVTAPNGKQKTIDLLYGGIPIVIAPSLAVGGTGKAMEEADAKARTKEPIAELKQFILDNSVDTKDLSRYESLYAGQKAKYETTKQAEDAIKSASDEYNAINAKINSYSKESAMADKMFEELNKVPEDQRDAAYNKRYDEAIEMKQRAIANANSIDADRYYASSVKYKDVEKSVGDYFMMKSEQGTWMGGLANRALKSTGSILAGLVDVGIVGSSPQLAFTPSMVKGRDELRSGLTNFFIDNFKDKSTTEQWDAATSQSTVKGAILGLGGMIPAMVAGAVTGGAGFMGAFAAEGYNDTMIEAQEAGIPPGERELVAIPVGITMGVIGELGLDKIPGAKVFAKQVTAKALKALGADFTATTFKNFVQNEIKSSIARGAITAGKGFVHGFEMGVKMDVGTNLIKDTYNVIKDKRDENENYMKVFNTPDSIAEYFSSAVESGISMGIGGAILGTPDIIKAAAEKNNFNGISDSHLEMFDLMSKDDMFNSLTTLKVKQDIIDGKITKEQGELQLRSYQELASLMKSLPDGLTNAQKRKALGLLQEKVLLKSQIEKGDPALTKKQRDRVAEIDNFLEQISEGKYSEVSEIKPEDVKVTIGDKVMWNPDAAKEMEQWDVAEVKDDSVTLTKGEETQTIPLKELQQHITDTYAVQKPTADESVLRAEQPEMGLQEMVEGDQKPDVVKAEEKEVAKTALEKPIGQELDELEQMFPEEGPTGENRGVAASNTQAMDEMHSRATDERVQKVIRTAQRLTKTLKSLIPTADIHLHETDESYNGAMEQLNGNKNSDGHFIISKKPDGELVSRIDINLSRATPVVIAHEVSHVVLQKAFGDNQKLFQSFQEKIAKVLSTESNQQLLDFANQDAYKEGGVTYEEYMVQLKALLSEQGVKLELSTAKKIAAVINEFVSKITNGKFKPFQEITDVKQVVDFVNKVTEAMAKGEAIDVEGVSKIGESSRSSIRGFHGTPHFFDKFTTEKMGTGEGVQAFGWGLYFTDLKGIAEAYAKKLTPKGLEIIDVEKYNYLKDMFANLAFAESPKDIIDIINISISDIEMNRGNFKGDIDISNYDIMNDYKIESFENNLEKNKRLDYILERISQSESPFKKELYETTKSLLNSNKSDVEKTKEFNNVVDKHTDIINSIIKQAINDPYSIVGEKLKNVYDVTIHEGKTPDQYTYIEWDKPQSPEVLKKIMKAFGKAEDNVGIKNPDYKRDVDLVKDLNGKEIYQAFSEILKSDKAASLFLLHNGIDGIKYPAESIARGAKSDTARGFNYVVFDENAIKINSVSRSSLRTAKQVDKIVKDARASGYSDRAIEELLKKRGVDKSIIDKSLGKKESGINKPLIAEERNQKTGDAKDIPGFDDVMNDIQQEADIASSKKKYWESELKKAKDKKDKKREGFVKKQLEEHASQEIKDAMEALENSDTFKVATDVQREQMIREVNKMFELREKKAPKPEELFGDVADVNKAMEEIKFEFEDAEKSKIYLEGEYEKAKAAYDKSVKEGDPSPALKRNMDKAKAEIEEYKTKNIEAAKEALRKTETYKKATLERQQKMEKYLEDRFLKRKEVLPTKLFEGAESGKKVTITEKKRWADQLKDFFRGIKDQTKFVDAIRKEIKDRIDGLAKGGKISAKQVEVIIERMSKVRFDKDISIDKFVDYVSKVFADAEYGSKKTQAKTLLSSIKKMSRNVEVDANYKKLAEDFKKIDISKVDDIDLYIENAKKLNEAMKGAFGKELKDSASINELSEYTEERLTEQREAAEKEMQEKLMELGVDATGLSMKEMKEVFDALSDEKKKPSKEQEKVARDTAKKAFDTYSAIIKEMLSTKKDPFTGEHIEFTETQRDLIERFMKMDLDLLSGKESIAAANSLINFITNGSISKMGKVVEKYEKLSSIKNVADKGIIAKTFRAWWSKDIGRVLMEQIATLPNVFSRAFKNDKIGDYVMKALGLSDVIQMHMKAVKESNAITDEYVKEFYNKKGKEFRSDESTIERGMLAFMLRSKPGAEAESFADRKKLIEDSIEVLSKGDERQQKMSDVYQKVYDKILSDSKTADEVRSKSNADNVEAVDWWVNKWAEKYDGLSDVLESVYNKILGNDINYTPDKVKLVDPKQGKNDLNQDYSVFLQNNGLYMEESGVLMEKKIKNELPDNRYIDLSFDLNNTMSMHDALVDMYTAAKVEGLNAAINSPFFAKIFPDRADRNLVIDLTKGYVRDMRQKTISDMNEINSAARKLGVISSMGVSMSLAGPTQILKQSIPIMVNTFINAGPVNMLSNLFSRGGFDFIDSLDMPISIRGKEATTQLQSVNRLVELAARSNRNEAMKIIEVANKRLLKLFLTNADVYVAKASWLAYYEKYMKDNKLTKGPIDFRTEKLNQEAADYAQKMVDKNQNVSIRELQGKMFKTKDPTKRFLVQMLLPFANYRMNQKVRMGNDMATIWSKTTSLSDKATAARSLAATGAESLAFRAMSGLISYTLWNMTNKIMGRDVDDEEEQKYIDNLYKGGYTALVTDFVSPIPPADPFVADGANTIMRKFQEDILNMEEDEVIGLFDGTNRKEKLQALGLFGIPLQRANQIAETIELANTGEFKDDFGRTKILREEDQEAMKTFAFISMLSITGVSFPEMNSIIKGGIKMAKKNAKVESKLTLLQQIEKQEAADEREEEKQDKINSIDELITKESDENVISELMRIKNDLEEGVDKEERAEEKEKMEELLQGYDSKSDMKRYDPDLYERTFGEGSDYYEEHKAEIEAEKKLRDYMKKKKDEQYNYEGENKGLWQKGNKKGGLWQKEENSKGLWNR